MKKRELNGVLLKIAEECGETVQMCAKCIFYGVDNVSPKNGNKQSNREKLVEELGDLMANIEVLIKFTDSGITKADIKARKEEKIIKLEKYLPEAK